MLLWQWKKRLSKQQLHILAFWCQLACAATAAHVLVLLSMFFMYKVSSPIKMTLTTTQENQQYVFATIERVNVHNGASAHAIGKTATQPVRPLQRPVGRKKRSMRVEPKKSESRVAACTQRKKIVPPASKSKKQVHALPQEKKVQAAPAKEAEQKAVAAPLAVAKDLENVHASTHVQTGEVEVVSSLSAQARCDEEGKIRVRQALEHAWHPPKGLPNTVSCCVFVRLGGQGELLKAAIQEPSSVVIFNMSVIRAVKTMIWPRWAYGKEFVMTFNHDGFNV